MAAGLVTHSITTAAGVTFTVNSWVPNTAAPDVGAVPVAMITDGTNTAPVSATLGMKVDGSGVTQPISGSVTATVSGTPAVTQSGTWTVQPGNTPNTVAWKVDGSAVTQPVSGTVTSNIGTGLTKGAGAADSTTLRATIDTAQLGTLVKGAVPVVSGGNDWFWFDVSQTNAAVQNTTGATGDYLESILCIVSTAATSQVSIKDGSGTARIILPNAVGGGVGNYPIPIGAVSKLGAWQISTAAGVQVIATGKFS